MAMKFAKIYLYYTLFANLLETNAVNDADPLG